MGTVGEPINPKAWLWYYKVIGGEHCPIVDTWWQTETGSIMISPLPGITSTKPGSATQPLPGILAEVVDEHDGKPIEEGQGLLVLKRPWPSMLRTIYKEDDRFVETYFAKFGKETYFVGDAARKDKDGYFWVIGRVDDVVNVSGHRLSTAEVESAIVACDSVAEAAVIGQTDELTGQAITAFVTLQGTIDGTPEIEDEIRAGVAERIGKFARPKRIIFADDLPKTRSGKIMRRLLRDIAEGRALGDVTTLRDPTVMAALEAKDPSRTGGRRRRVGLHQGVWPAGHTPRGAGQARPAPSVALSTYVVCAYYAPPEDSAGLRFGSTAASTSLSDTRLRPPRWPPRCRARSCCASWRCVGGHGTASPDSQAGGSPLGQRRASSTAVATSQNPWMSGVTTGNPMMNSAPEITPAYPMMRGNRPTRIALSATRITPTASSRFPRSPRSCGMKMAAEVKSWCASG